jgi:Ca-activated chloride channel homolog
MARLGFVTILLAVALVRPSAQQPVFRAETDLVTFAVSVADRRGNFVAELSADDFEIYEDGQPQAIKYFARGEGGAAPELHVGLLFDTSDSMGQDIQLARSAAVRFLNTLPDAKDMTVVDFDTEVRVAKYGQQDFARMVERIRSRKPRGMTALYDALGLYLDGAEENGGRTILVIFTDGGDTRSTIRLNDVVTLVRASHVTVYTVGFMENQSGGARGEQRVRLTQIAAEAGGESFFPSTMEQVEKAYDRILQQIRAQYHLGFVSTNTKQDGTWRKVEVKVKGPDSRSVRLQSRKGYFAVYKK